MHFKRHEASSILGAIVCDIHNLSNSALELFKDPSLDSVLSESFPPWGVHRHKYASLGDSYLVVISAFASLSVLARRFALSFFRLVVSSRTVFLYSLVAAKITAHITVSLSLCLW